MNVYGKLSQTLRYKCENGDIVPIFYSIISGGIWQLIGYLPNLLGLSDRHFISGTLPSVSPAGDGRG